MVMVREPGLIGGSEAAGIDRGDGSGTNPIGRPGMQFGTGEKPVGPPHVHLKGGGGGGYMCGAGGGGGP